jgi:hypothetical protein
MNVPSKEADLALAERDAFKSMNEAHKTGDMKLIRQKTAEWAAAQKARREG